MAAKPSEQAEAFAALIEYAYRCGIFRTYDLTDSELRQKPAFVGDPAAVRFDARLRHQASTVPRRVAVNWFWNMIGEKMRNMLINPRNIRSGPLDDSARFKRLELMIAALQTRIEKLEAPPWVANGAEPPKRGPGRPRKDAAA